MKRTKTQIGLSLAFAGVLATHISAFADWGSIQCATYDSSTKKVTVKGCSYKYGTYIKFNGKICSAKYDWSTGDYCATLPSDPEPGSYCVGVGTGDDDEKQTCLPVCQVGAASVWRDGSGAPATTLGANGDYYLNDVTGDVYKKSAGTYTIVANIRGATGLMGLQGLAGPAGPIGPVGATGPAGAKGATGATGPAGAQGVAGPVGPAGATGATGLTGAVGPAGAQGVAGPVGPTGATGLTGAAGPAGPQGVAGPVGPAGATGLTGAAGPKGDTGLTGATGAQGVAGPKGDTGLTGATGAAGPQGVAGAVGATGSTGAKGDTGAAGPQGPKGDTGATGNSVEVTSVAVGDVNLPTGGVEIQLVDALNNAIGNPVFVANGAQGPKGDPGSPGLNGANGLNGAVGPAGLQGLPGAQGPAGPQGSAGPKGDTGAAGAQGVAGATGADGKNGLSYALFSNDSATYTLPAFAAIPNTSTSKTLTLTPGQWLVKGTATFKNTVSSTTIPWIPLTVTLNGVSVDINNLATVPTVVTTIESARQLTSGGPVFPAFVTVTMQGFVNVAAGSPITVSISAARQAPLTGDVSQVLMIGSQISAVQFDSISAQ